MISPVPGERQSRSTGVLRDGNPRGGILRSHPSGDGRRAGLNSPQCPGVTPRCLPKGSKSLFQDEAGNHETSLIQRHTRCLTAWNHCTCLLGKQNITHLGFHSSLSPGSVISKLAILLGGNRTSLFNCCQEELMRRHTYVAN